MSRIITSARVFKVIRLVGVVRTIETIRIEKSGWFSRKVPSPRKLTIFTFNRFYRYDGSDSIDDANDSDDT